MMPVPGPELPLDLHMYFDRIKEIIEPEAQTR